MKLHHQNGDILLLFIVLNFSMFFVRAMKTLDPSFNKTLNESPSHHHLEESTKYPILIPEPDVDIEYLVLTNESSIDWEGGFKRCSSCKDTFGPPANYMVTPSSCRCDKKCIKYGDCCATALKEIRQIPKEPWWRCVKLPNSTNAVRMISKCPSSYPNNLNKQLCENTTCPSKDSIPNYASLCPLLDVPVLHNGTRDLYRSIYCARCHSVSNKDIYSIRPDIICSDYFQNQNQTDWEAFNKRAVYQQGKLQWSDPFDPSLYCTLYFQEFQPNVIGSLIPDVRYCPYYAVDECSLELKQEEDHVLHNLCHSYMEMVLVNVSDGTKSTFKQFKNPHCAKCRMPDLDIKKAKCKERSRGPSATFHSTRMFTKVDSAPVGINILLHFSLDMDDGYVGYTSKCDDDEIWDFIRLKCVPVICPKGFDLVDGDCEKAFVDEDDTTTNETSSGSDKTSLGSNSSEPCFLIILNAGEYKLLQNGSLLVNHSHNSTVVAFQPHEYEQYNGSSMSICAKNVDQTFERSFAPALSYLSNILLALSVLFSLLHVILYIILQKMRNLPGTNLLCLTTCLLISQFIFLTLINASNKVVCVVASITMHYFFLASFFWMNIMSFDIWRTFSSEFLVRRYSGDSVKTFLKYSSFAWVTPLVIVVVAVLTDFTLPDALLMDPDFGLLFKKIRPLYGNNLCWINQKLSLFLFFAFPVALIILCNLTLFTLTVKTMLLQHREGDKFINGSNNSGSKAKAVMSANGVQRNKVPLHGCNSMSTKKSDEIRLKLYAKLALIMGLTWILGFLSAFTNWEWLRYPFVLFNGLQGTFIFFAFDFKLKIWHMLKEEFGWEKKKSSKRHNGDDTGSSDMTRRGTTTISSTLDKSSKTNSNI
ncbi:unnamed protein product [Orchesella dallaii]|uniref:G-protein coupled receptors family 2 profile 2 domain-containing protein n=1 Tax=Orchesella dallaii TaxID=48710 RepID=A0ABP1S452_9HEXA